MTSQSVQRSRHWCFTMNNPSETLSPPNTTMATLLIYAPEIGSSGTPHFQGYIELEKSQRLSWLKKWLPSAHFEPRRGTRLQAVTYCLKNFIECQAPEQHSENSCDSFTTSNSKSNGNQPQTIEVCGLTQPIIYGYVGSWQEYLESITPKKKESQRDRLEKQKELIKQGATDIELADNDFDLWVRYHKSFKAYRAVIGTQRSHEMTFVILVGPTGCGKSKYCLENYPNAYWKQRSNWWDGYENHETVIIDEFYGWLPYDLLLRITDRYPMQVEIKGGQANFTAKTICITSNLPPKAWYKNISNLAALYRRVTRWIIHLHDGTIVDQNEYPVQLETYSY